MDALNIGVWGLSSDCLFFLNFMQYLQAARYEKIVTLRWLCRFLSTASILEFVACFLTPVASGF